MITQKQDTQLIETLEQIAGTLDNSRKLISTELIYEFQSKLNNVKQNLAEIKQKERVLRIGIVGEVKAGKSSFLNSLIFDGEQILPKAPTPMTAALTKIGYSENPSAKIVFYKDYDWDIIEQRSNECKEILNEKFNEELSIYNRNMNMEFAGQSGYAGFGALMPTMDSVERLYKDQIPSSLYACYELSKMADESGIEISDYLGQTKEIQGGSSSEEFMKELNHYVGAEGQFTPIVKHTEVYINSPLLKDIEIIDTPGLNDPILSRSEKTKEFLMNCDAVFLLSYAGQFLGSEDIDFLTTSLPGEGIEKVILVGSKFDSGILDYKKSNIPFKEAFKRTRGNLVKQATDNIEAVLSSSYVPAIFHDIKKSLPPVFVSSLMYVAAKHIEQDKALSEEEEMVIKQMTKRFEGFSTEPEFLYDLSNIKNVRDKTFAEIKSEKEITIQKRVANMTKTQKNKFLGILESVSITARHNLVDLNQYDYEQLEEKLKNLKEKLNSIRGEVKSMFETSNIKAQHILKDLEIEVEKEIDNHVGISTSTRQEKHHKTIKAGFLGLKKEHYTELETIHSANVQEAITGIRKYVTKTKEIVNKQFRQLFNVEDLKKSLKNSVIGAFDTSDTNFNENDILLPVEIVLGKLTIPSIEIDGSAYDEEIIREFSNGIVEGNDISRLMLEQERLLYRIAKDIEKRLQDTAQSIEEILLEHASIFVDNIEQQLTENVEIIQSLLKDKEQSIKEYETFIDKIAQFKIEIKQI